MSEAVPQRTETILLVEDALRVRAVVREILEMNGYNVLEARHGAEALEISERHRGPIHLMVTDVVMPQMSGRELAQRLQPLRPDMRVLTCPATPTTPSCATACWARAWPSSPSPSRRTRWRSRCARSSTRRRGASTGRVAAPPANGNGAVPEAAVSAAAGPLVQRAEDVGTTRPSRV